MLGLLTSLVFVDLHDPVHNAAYMPFSTFNRATSSSIHELINKPGQLYYFFQDLPQAD